MGTNPSPWICWQSLPWRSMNSNYDGGVNGRNSTPPIAVFSSDLYANRFGSGADGDATVAAPGRFLQWSSAINPPPPNPTINSPPAERRFLIFDQSGHGTNLLLSSVGPRPPVVWDLKNHRSPQKPKLVLDRYDGGMGSVGGMPGAGTGNCCYYAPLNLSAGGTAEVSDGGGGCDEMREDTDEIDALLYSDSEFEEEASRREEEEEEEASTGDPIPQGPTSVSAEQVASNSVVSTKRRRLLTDEEAIDASLMDTASSAARRASDCVGDKAGRGDHDDQSSCVAGARELGEQEPPRAGAGKGLKRARIQETLCVLRKIVPGGKGKDDAAVLDEAIRYLRSLKLKAKALGNKLK